MPVRKEYTPTPYRLNVDLKMWALTFQAIAFKNGWLEDDAFVCSFVCLFVCLNHINVPV